MSFLDNVVTRLEFWIFFIINPTIINFLKTLRKVAIYKAETN